LPFVQRKIAETRDATLKSVCDDIAKSVAGHEFTKTLPNKGLSKVEYLLFRIFSLFFSFRTNYLINLKNIEILKKLILIQVKFLDVFINYQNQI